MDDEIIVNIGEAEPRMGLIFTSSIHRVRFTKTLTSRAPLGGRE